MPGWWCWWWCGSAFWQLALFWWKHQHMQTWPMTQTAHTLGFLFFLPGSLLPSCHPVSSSTTGSCVRAGCKTKKKVPADENMRTYAASAFAHCFCWFVVVSREHWHWDAYWEICTEWTMSFSHVRLHVLEPAREEIFCSFFWPLAILKKLTYIHYLDAVSLTTHDGGSGGSAEMSRRNSLVPICILVCLSVRYHTEHKSNSKHDRRNRWIK